MKPLYLVLIICAVYSLPILAGLIGCFWGAQ